MFWGEVEYIWSVWEIIGDWYNDRVIEIIGNRLYRVFDLYFDILIWFIF